MCVSIIFTCVSCAGGSKLSDEVYMEVVVGGEEPVPHDRPYDGTALSKDFMPVAWAAAYGQDTRRFLISLTLQTQIMIVFKTGT